MAVMAANVKKTDATGVRVSTKIPVARKKSQEKPEEHDHEDSPHHDGAQRVHVEDDEGDDEGEDQREQHPVPPRQLVEEPALEDGVHHGGVRADVHVLPVKGVDADIGRRGRGDPDDAERAGKVLRQDLARLHQVVVDAPRVLEDLRHLGLHRFRVCALVLREVPARKDLVHVREDALLRVPVQELPDRVEELLARLTYVVHPGQVSSAEHCRFLALSGGEHVEKRRLSLVVGEIAGLVHQLEVVQEVLLELPVVDQLVEAEVTEARTGTCSATS